MPDPLSGIADGSFVAGTRIAVMRPDLGRTECPVEQLVDGDLLLTRSGQGAACKPLRGVTKRHIDPAAHAELQPTMPVRVCAGALGPDSPRRDLLLPPEELLLFAAAQEGAPPHLVPVGALLNGTTLLRETRPGPLIWYTLALDVHDAILAENLAAGTARTGRLCARLLGPGPALLALRAGLRPSSAAPSPADVQPPAAAGTADSEAPDPLRAYAGDAEIPAALGSPDWEYRFLLPPDSGPVRLVSAAYPSPAPSDQRRLGVCVVAMQLDGEALPLDGPALGPGFHPAEGTDADQWRWTNGNAWLVLPHSAARRRLVVRINDWHRRLAEG